MQENHDVRYGARRRQLYHNIIIHPLSSYFTSLGFARTTKVRRARAWFVRVILFFDIFFAFFDEMWQNCHFGTAKFWTRARASHAAVSQAVANCQWTGKKLGFCARVFFYAYLFAFFSEMRESCRFDVFSLRQNFDAEAGFRTQTTRTNNRETKPGLGAHYSTYLLAPQKTKTGRG